MQGFALKRPGSGLKSLVHAARGAPPRKMLRSCTECLLTLERPVCTAPHGIGTAPHETFK